MAKLPRVLYKIFGVDGPSDDFGKFGSRAAGAPVKTKDVSVIQSLTAWDNGHKDAILAANRLPFIEDQNSVDYVHGYMLAYLFQEGIPEWEGNTEYSQYSIVKKAGSFELYGSKVNANVGNTLPSQMDDTNWKYLGPTVEPAGVIKEFAGTVLPDGYLWADGSAVSRSTYARLYAAIGVAFGSGDGSTTFNLPDRRGKFAVGKATAGTFSTLAATGGSETHAHTQAGHTHDFSHTHSVTIAAVATDAQGSHWHNESHITYEAVGYSAHEYPSDAYGAGDACADEIKNVAQSSSNAGLRLAGWHHTRTSSDGVHTHTTPGQTVTSGAASTSTTGSATPTINSSSGLPPYIVLNYIIKT